MPSGWIAGTQAFSECRQNISKPPSEYLKKFYYDTVNFDANALRLAVEFAGADHLLAGSDYPHQIGSLKRMITSIEKLDIPDEAKKGIFSGNAARLVGIVGRIQGAGCGRKQDLGDLKNHEEMCREVFVIFEVGVVCRISWAAVANRLVFQDSSVHHFVDLEAHVELKQLAVGHLVGK